MSNYNSDYFTERLYMMNKYSKIKSKSEGIYYKLEDFLTPEEIEDNNEYINNFLCFGSCCNRYEMDNSKYHVLFNNKEVYSKYCDDVYEINSNIETKNCLNFVIGNEFSKHQTNNVTEIIFLLNKRFKENNMYEEYGDRNNTKIVDNNICKITTNVFNNILN